MDKDIEVTITSAAMNNLRNCQYHMDGLRNEIYIDRKSDDPKDNLILVQQSFIRSILSALSMGGRMTAEDDKSLLGYGGVFTFGMIYHRHDGEWSVHT